MELVALLDRATFFEHDNRRGLATKRHGTDYQMSLIGRSDLNMVYSVVLQAKFWGERKACSLSQKLIAIS